MTSHIPAVVVGGGISGLVCAYELRKAGVDAKLLEASLRVGGVIRSERREGYLLELGPQSFTGTPPLRALCAELGIASDLVAAPARAPRFVLVDGNLQAVPLDPPSLLMSPLLSGATKRSIARDLFGKSQPPEQDESVASFVRRKFSAELLDKLAGPFISGIYAGDPERLSIRSTFPHIYEAEKSAGGVIRGMKRAAKKKGDSRQATLFSFRTGNEALIRALQSKLGAAARVDTEVIALRRNPAANTFELKIRAAGQQETLTADQVILATPTDIAGRLLAEINPDFDRLLSGIEYAPVGIVSLGYPRAAVGHSLHGFGFLVPRSSGYRLLGTVWNSSLFPGRAPEGNLLLTSFVGGATDPQAVAQPAPQVAKIVQGELAAILAIPSAPTLTNVQIYPRALPQYNLGHSDRLADMDKLRQATPGVWLAGNYLRGPSIGACVEQAQGVAEQVLSRLRP